MHKVHFRPSLDRRRELESDGKIIPIGIGVLMVWQKQGNAWKLLARQGFKTET